MKRKKKKIEMYKNLLFNDIEAGCLKHLGQKSMSTGKGGFLKGRKEEKHGKER